MIARTRDRELIKMGDIFSCKSLFNYRINAFLERKKNLKLNWKCKEVELSDCFRIVIVCKLFVFCNTNTHNKMENHGWVD